MYLGIIKTVEYLIKRYDQLSDFLISSAPRESSQAGQEDVVGHVLGFELVAADGSVGRAQVARFPGKVTLGRRNGDLVREDTDFSVLKKDVTIEVIIFQAKTESSFKGKPFDTLSASLRDLFELSRPLSELTGVYIKKFWPRQSCSVLP
jgi:hypothetical protein